MTCTRCFSCFDALSFGSWIWLLLRSWTWRAPALFTVVAFSVGDVVDSEPGSGYGVVPEHLREASARFRDGLRYTSGRPEVVSQKRGKVQFEALRQHGGLQPGTRFLEIGCGALELASFLIPFLDEDKYACIEPNAFLVHDALYVRPGLLPEVLRKRAIFVRDSNFVGRKLLELHLPAFDIVYSHSVLSHAAWWQIPQYLRRTSCFLAEGGISLASLVLGGKDSWDECWVYPGVSKFRWSTIRRAVAMQYLTVQYDKEMRQLIEGKLENENHDWLRIRFRAGSSANRSCALEDVSQLDHQSTWDHQSACTGVGTFYNPWFEVLPNSCDDDDEHACKRVS